MSSSALKKKGSFVPIAVTIAATCLLLGLVCGTWLQIRNLFMVLVFALVVGIYLAIRTKRGFIIALLLLFLGIVISCNGMLRTLCGDMSIDNLPDGDCIGSFDSPDKACTVRTYLCDGGATVALAVRAAVTYNTQWYRWPRNIYWQYHCHDATVTWPDAHTVDINGVVLNVDRDAYDWRFH